MELKDTLDMLKNYPNVQTVVVHQDGGFEISFFENETSKVVKAEPFPVMSDMPPDDVMLFASTEDVAELMKQRSGDEL